jgi:hypothetical protein
MVVSVVDVVSERPLFQREKMRQSWRIFLLIFEARVEGG